VKDVNGDGWDDVLLTNVDDADAFDQRVELVVLLQDPATHDLSPPAIYRASPTGWSPFLVSSIAEGDVNGDGVNDIIIGHTDGVTVLDPTNGYAILSVIDDRAQYLDPKTARAGDIDGDGKLDLVVLTSSTEYPTHLKIYHGDGTGHFDGGSELPLPGGCCFGDLQVLDIDGDGKQDMLLDLQMLDAPYDSQYGLWAYFNLGGGVFGSVPKFLAAGGGFWPGMAIGDIDGDGKPDLATAYVDPHSSSVPVMRAYLHGKLGRPYTSFLQWSSDGSYIPGADAIRDMTGDGKQDLVFRDGTFSDPETGSPICLEGYAPSAGKYVYRYQVPCVYQDNMTAAGDINGDGLMDIVTADTVHGMGWAYGTNSPDIKNLVVGEGFSAGTVAFNAQNASTTATIAEPAIEVTLSVNHGKINMTSWPEECSRPDPKKNRIVCQYDNLGVGQSASGVVHYSVIQSAPYMQMTMATRATTPTIETIVSDNAMTKATWIRQL
jgi:hypothetical protein